MNVGPVVAFIQGIGGGEIVVIFVIFLMLFGAKKLPGIARSLGKSVSEFQRAAREVREEFLNADRELNKPSTPVVDTPTLPGASDGPGSDGSDAYGGGGGGDETGGGLAAAMGSEVEPAGGPIEPVRESVPEPAAAAPDVAADPVAPAPAAAPEVVADASAPQPADDANPGHVEVPKA
jgi:sec-independent protein translocase protein TatA